MNYSVRSLLKSLHSNDALVSINGCELDSDSHKACIAIVEFLDTVNMEWLPEKSLRLSSIKWKSIASELAGFLRCYALHDDESKATYMSDILLLSKTDFSSVKALFNDVLTQLDNEYGINISRLVKRVISNILAGSEIDVVTDYVSGNVKYLDGCRSLIDAISLAVPVDETNQIEANKSDHFLEDCEALFSRSKTLSKNEKLELKECLQTLSLVEHTALNQFVETIHWRLEDRHRKAKYFARLSIIQHVDLSSVSQTV